jgi:hypothetical protein
MFGKLSAPEWKKLSKSSKHESNRLKLGTCFMKFHQNIEEYTGQSLQGNYFWNTKWSRIYFWNTEQHRGPSKNVNVHHSLNNKQRETCRAIGSKILSCGMGISRRVLRGATYDPGHWNILFYRRGFGLVVSVVVPSMLVVLPYARGRGF